MYVSIQAVDPDVKPPQKARSACDRHAGSTTTTTNNNNNNINNDNNDKDNSNSNSNSNRWGSVGSSRSPRLAESVGGQELRRLRGSIPMPFSPLGFPCRIHPA